MHVLILGSGGREHALAWKISQSPLCSKIFVAPGNSGTSNIAQNIALDLRDFESIVQVILKFHIQLVVVGPEEPLVAGVCDYIKERLKASAPMLIGPSKASAILEGSKVFAKNFMKRHHIPTADYKVFNQDEYDEALQYLKSAQQPYVIKADGLAKGKGVRITHHQSEAIKVLDSFFKEGVLGDSGKQVVIERFLEGKEFSFFVLLDGKSWKILPSAIDFKYAEDGNMGALTGGMAAVSPVPFLSKNFKDRLLKDVVEPTLAGMKKENLMYTGFLYFGMIQVDGKPMVLEYNVRLGDPETQCILPLLKSDLLALLCAAAKQELSSSRMRHVRKSAMALVLASSGYPHKYKIGFPITGVNLITDALLFHAGTHLNKENMHETAGGRVLSMVSVGENFTGILPHLMKEVEKIRFEGVAYRKDIEKYIQ